MKVFYKYFAVPLLISVIAGVLYIIDALLGPVLVANGSFMWVAFVSWAIFFGATIKERIKAFIGIIIGFISAVVMMLITSSFTLNIHTISISCLLGVLVVNFLVMFLDKTEKVWLNSITGVFTGIFISFSGLGIGMSPLASTSEAFLMLAIIAIYTIFGMLCGFLSIYFSAKIKSALEKTTTQKAGTKETTEPTNQVKTKEKTSKTTRKKR